MCAISINDPDEIMPYLENMKYTYEKLMDNNEFYRLIKYDRTKQALQAMTSLFCRYV